MIRYAGFSRHVTKEADFNSTSTTLAAGVYTSGNAFFVAKFSANDAISDGNILAYIDTSNGGNIGPFGGNSNLSGYTADANFMGKNKWSLASGSDSSYLKAAYTDAGTKVWLLDSDAGVKIDSPQARDKIDIAVRGPIATSSTSKVYTAYLNSGSSAGDTEVLTAMDSSDANALTDAQLPHLINTAVTEKVKGNSTSITIKEKIGVDVDAKFDTYPDIKDLVAKIDSGKFSYKVTLGSNEKGLNLGGNTFTANSETDDVTIYLFGQQYKLKSATLTGAKTIVLEQAVSGGGGSGGGGGTMVASPPKNLKVISVKPYGTAMEGSADVTVAWDTVAGADSYTLTINSADEKDDFGMSGAATASNLYTFQGLPKYVDGQWTIATIAVRAHTSAGWSAGSAPVQVSLSP